MDGIVSNGEKRYRKALVEEEHRIVDGLTARMNEEKDPRRRAEIKKSIKDVQREFREKRKNIKWSLFGKS
jgi:hypothetical protein